MQPGQNPAKITPSQPPRHPPDVDGIKVVSAEWVQAPPGREEDPSFVGRTTLVLEDSSRRCGCGECDFTSTRWTAVVKHRADMHGAVALKGRLGRPRDERHTQLELAAGPAAEPQPAVLTPAQEDVLPASPKTVQAIAHSGPMAMTVGEVVELAMHMHAAGAALERMTEDRDNWKAQALAAKRDLQKVHRILGKATDVVSKKEDAQP